MNADDQRTFQDIKTKEEWLFSIVKESMKTLYLLTEESNLENAIAMGKIQAMSEVEKECAYMLAAFLREELSGNLIPPPSLKKMYMEMCLSM